MFTLKNELLELKIDNVGCLHHLINLKTGRDYAGGKPVWRLFYKLGFRVQNEVVCDTATAKVTKSENKLFLTWENLETADGVLGISVTVSVYLHEDESCWSISIDNQAEDVTVREIQFPLLGNCGVTDEQALITTAFGGERYENARDHIAAVCKPTVPYRHEDYNCLQSQVLYPGGDVSGNCYVFSGENEGLYCGSHDDQFRSTAHIWRIQGDSLEVGFGKQLLLDNGEHDKIEGFVFSPYSGNWRVAARKYRSWVNTWFKPDPRPKWLEALTGWQRIILKHQNGDIHYNYEQLPQIFREGAQAGIKTLFMFGWWPGGMDRLYPEYEADDEMGGLADLKEGIRVFQEELGGQVICYFSGRLVDRETEFYKEKGHKLAIKTEGDGDLVERYVFSNRSAFDRIYGITTLSPMCLEAPEWREELKHFADIAIELGCAGVFYDQLGSLEYPCCDPNHGHSVPYLNQTERKRQILTELRQYIKGRAPEMAFGLEVFTDPVAQSADFIHGLYLQNLFAINSDWEIKGEKPRYRNFVQWSRYIYPHVILTDRDIRDDTDIKRRVNHCVLRGLRHDIEIYRCRKSVAETPNYQQYLGEISALRQRHSDLLLCGTYVDMDGFSHNNSEIDASSFEFKNRKALVLAQSHLTETQTELTVPGWSFESGDGVGKFKINGCGEDSTVVLGKDGLAVLIFRKSL